MKQENEKGEKDLFDPAIGKGLWTPSSTVRSIFYWTRVSMKVDVNDNWSDGFSVSLRECWGNSLDCWQHVVVVSIDQIDTRNRWRRRRCCWWLRRRWKVDLRNDRWEAMMMWQHSRFQKIPILFECRRFIPTRFSEIWTMNRSQDTNASSKGLVQRIDGNVGESLEENLVGGETTILEFCVDMTTTEIGTRSKVIFTGINDEIFGRWRLKEGWEIVESWERWGRNEWWKLTNIGLHVTRGKVFLKEILWSKNKWWSSWGKKRNWGPIVSRNKFQSDEGTNHGVIFGGATFFPSQLAYQRLLRKENFIVQYTTEQLNDLVLVMDVILLLPIHGNPIPTPRHAVRKYLLVSTREWENSLHRLDLSFTLCVRILTPGMRDLEERFQACCNIVAPRCVLCRTCCVEFATHLYR
jgi:hypothetical protein